MMYKSIIIFFTICFILTACENKFTFDKAGWIDQGDLGLSPNRNKMLNDLIKNHQLKGLTYKQLIDKLGVPEKNVVEDSCSIYYFIVTDYANNIDPVYTKTLEFKFDKDSIITDFKINETTH